jgi:hypothetical protein
MSFEKFIIVMQIMLHGFLDIGIRTRFRITFEASETIDCHFVPQRQASGTESRTVRHLLVTSVEQMGSYSGASKQQKKSKHEKIWQWIQATEARRLNKQISALKFVSRKSKRTESRTTMAKMRTSGDQFRRRATQTRRCSFRQRWGSVQGTSDADKATLLPTALRISSGDERRRQGEDTLPKALGSEGERRIKAKMHLPTTPPGIEGHAIFDNMFVDWHCIPCR